MQFLSDIVSGQKAACAPHYKQLNHWLFSSAEEENCESF